MQNDRALPRPIQTITAFWNHFQKRCARLAEFDNCDSVQMLHIAQDLGTSVSELRILAGQDGDAADLLRRRLHSLKIDPARIEATVMRDLQRCCSQCGDKGLCEHELEDHPKATSWPKYCPNEHTIDALVAEKSGVRIRT